MSVEVFLDNTFNDPILKGTTDDIVPGSYVTDKLLTRNSDSLLVTIGDSWTYGGNLILLSKDRHKFRFQNTFGYHLSDKLNFDWYNLSILGRSNRWMVNQFSKLCEIRDQLPYKKILVVITLTENCREFNSNLDKDIKYSTLLKNINHVDELFTIIGEHNAKLILRNKIDNIQLIIGRTYVDNSYRDLLDEFSLSKSWLNLLLEHSSIEIPTDNCFVVGEWVINKLTTIDQFCNLSRSQILGDINSIIDQSRKRIDYLDLNKYSIKTNVYSHPNPEGHKIWADYVLQEYRKKYDNEFRTL